jgi:alkanesulfonate monooxygenase SsuD/methylene tetrahydromethanopterin reductase-like flavin-dependent oxidoreductase (luciferase family)
MSVLPSRRRSIRLRPVLRCGAVSHEPIKVGILLPTRDAVMSGRFEVAPLLAMAERVEAEGYDSIWAGDSLLARPRFEPLTLLAAVAARTRRPLLGTAVLLPALRHPLVLAHAVATVDRIAEGRLVLGVGIAPDSPAVRKEFEAAGVPFAQRVGRLEESITICRRLWADSAGERGLSFHGRYWSLGEARLLPTPHRPGGPPIWMGGEVDAATRRAGRLADAWLPNSVTPEAWADGWTRVQEIAAAERGKIDHLTPALYTTINVGRDGKTAETSCAGSWRRTTRLRTRPSRASRDSMPATPRAASSASSGSSRPAFDTSSSGSAAGTRRRSSSGPRARSCPGRRDDPLSETAMRVSYGTTRVPRTPAEERETFCPDLVRAHAQAHDVAAVSVEAQRPARPGLRARGAAECSSGSSGVPSTWLAPSEDTAGGRRKSPARHRVVLN